MGPLLILDYSTDRSEADLIRRWLPPHLDSDVLFVENERSLPAELPEAGYTHAIHSGSAHSITTEQPFSARAQWCIQQFQRRGVSQMGICFGHQLLALAILGPSAVRRSPRGIEAGWGKIEIAERGRELWGVGREEVVWQSHFDEIVALPPGSSILASSTHTRVQAFINEALRFLGTQFHPEFDEALGNAQFAHDRALLEAHGVNVDDELDGGPSFATGPAVIGSFLGLFR